MAFPSLKGLEANVLCVVYICTVELMALFYNEVHNSHSEDLINKNKVPASKNCN